ncbi:uncharacterized protein LOC113870032 [Abrus precatorius]|uniref:Uncharacterized protein LOC113870032 n=1 Tax=Abrus precatorius TaxID=3816 RepID=A0A8B8M5I8_ABRPR|nr:uncharacterized protein LOC113870032 [Abrus precatorius]
MTSPQNVKEVQRLAGRITALAKIFAHNGRQEIPQPSIAKQECMDIENMPKNWMTPIIQYLTSSSLPKDPASAKKIRMHTAKYLLLGNELYRRGISTPMLKCLNEDQASYVMREIHDGICGTHVGGHTMAAKIL